MAETAVMEALALGPWRGCVSSRARDRLKANEIGPDSTNWWIDPEDGRATRRLGSLLIGDTQSGSGWGTEVSGILESAWGARAFQVMELPSPSLSDGYGTYGIVYADEADKEGLFYFRSSNSGGSNQVMCKSYGTTHYALAASTAVRMKIPAVVVEGGSGKYIRHEDALARRFQIAGTRKAMQIGGRAYFPSATGTPLAYNMRFNDATGSGTEIERVYPWGLPPPMFPPELDTLPGSQAAVTPFKDGDAFYVTVAFEFADGTVGPAFAIRPNATTAAKGGTVKIGTPGAGQYYPSITLKNVAIGPQMPVPVVARRVYVSVKENLAAATTKLTTASEFTLYAAARISNNTSTSVQLFGGEFVTLETDVELTFRHRWPPRAQIAVPVDGRTLLGGAIRPNPLAIILAPSGSNASRQLNLGEDDATLYGSIFYHFRVDSTTLKLKRTSGGATTTVSFTLTSYTLQGLVDAINESTTAGIGGTDIDEWCAQLVPGVDGNIAASNLRITTNVGEDTQLADATSNNIRTYGPNYPGYCALSETYLATFDTDYQGSLMSRGGPSYPDGSYSNFQIGSAFIKGPSTSSVGDLLNIVPVTGVGGVVAVYIYQNARYVLRNIRGGGTGEDEDYRLLPLDTRHGGVSFLACGEASGIVYAVGDDGMWITNGSETAVISLDSFDPDLKTGEWAAEIAASDALTKKRGVPYFTAQCLGRKIRVRYRSTTAISYHDRGQDYWFREGVEAGGLGALLRAGDIREVYGWSAPDTGRKFGVMGTYFTSTGRHNIGCSDTNGGTANGRVDEIDVPGSYRDNSGSYTSNGFTMVYHPAPGEDVCLHRLECKGKKAGTGLSVTPYMDRTRAETITALALPTSGSAPYIRRIFECDMNARGNKECLEFLFADDGTSDVPVDFSWMVAEIERTSAATRLA